MNEIPIKIFDKNGKSHTAYIGYDAMGHGMWVFELHESAFDYNEYRDSYVKKIEEVEKNMFTYEEMINLEDLVPYYDDKNKLGYLKVAANKRTYVYGEKWFKRNFKIK